MFKKLEALQNTPEATEEAKLVLGAVLDLNERLKVLEAIAIRQGALAPV